MTPRSSMANHTIATGGRYPTKKEILTGGPLHTPRELKKLKRWKELFFPGWSALPKKVRFTLLRALITALAPQETYILAIKKEWAVAGNTIILGQTPSIISCLHEIGHLLHGGSELDACRYSVHLFKEAFPRSYAQLMWRGHVLVKRKK